MKIPLSAPDITEFEIASVVEVLRSSRLSLGPRLLEFEHGIAEYVGAKHGVAVNSGTSGLHLCVNALGLKAGDEVVTTPFSFVASANALLYEQVKPVFVDIDPKTLNIDVSKIESAITPRTKAILVVHVFGRPALMPEISAIAEKHKLKIIEDACESIGAEIGGQMTGNIGDCGVFAFYPNKQITTGEGGMIVTDDDLIAEKTRRLRNQGRDANLDWLEHCELGYNYRMSEVNCALGIQQLNRIEEILNKRETVARKYRERLKDNQHLILPEADLESGRISWFTYVVRLADNFDRKDRDLIVNRLHDRQIGCGRYFAPIHLQPYYVKNFGYKKGDLPLTESAADRTIALPFFNKITDSQIDEVCETLTELVKELR